MKVPLNVTVDEDVRRWLVEVAAEDRLKLSQATNQILAKAMRQESMEIHEGAMTDNDRALYDRAVADRKRLVKETSSPTACAARPCATQARGRKAG